MEYNFMTRLSSHSYATVSFNNAESGLSPNGGLEFIGVQRLPNEPSGSFELKLTNVVIGSSISIEVESTKASLYYGIASTTINTIIVDTYAQGSVNNDLVIKVRKASEAPYYQAFETKTTSIQGSQSIYVNQVRDDV